MFFVIPLSDFGIGFMLAAKMSWGLFPSPLLLNSLYKIGFVSFLKCLIEFPCALRC